MISSQFVSCSSCGAVHEADARFCPNCGRDLKKAASGADLLVGRTLADRYQLTDRLGLDALGRLYRAETSDGPCIVRLFHRHLSRNKAFAHAMAAGAEQASRVQHPGLVRVLDHGRSELDGYELLWMAMELYEGRALQDIVWARGLLPQAQVVSIGRQVLEALAALHDRGLIHGDLRPETIVMGFTDEGELRARLIDGQVSALAAAALGRLSALGSSLGAGRYRAPELLDEAHGPQPAADLYSVAAVLYELLTGTAPFVSASTIELERMHREHTPTPPSIRAPWRSLAPALEKALLQGLAKNPLERYASAAAMADALERALEETRASGSDEPSVPAAARLPAARRVVGRAALVDALLSIVQLPVEVMGSRGAAAIVTGAAGMGKSAIVALIEERLASTALAVVRVEGRRSLARPLEPFAEMLRAVLGLARDSTREQQERLERELRERYDGSDDDVKRLVDRLTGRPSRLLVLPDVVQREEAAALRAFVGRVLAAGPTLVVIEDADSMDRESLRLAQDLIELAAGSAMSVLVTGRVDPWPEMHLAHLVRFELKPLADDDARAMLRAALAGIEVPTEAVDMAVSWAKGSPLKLLLWAQALARQDAADREGQGRASTSVQQRLGSMSELVAVVLRGVPPVARRWLQCAALAGGRVPVRMLSEWERPFAGSDEVLQACLSTGLVRVEGQHVAFVSEGLREVLAALAPESERAQTHAFIASWWQQSAGGTPLEVVAAHLEAAGSLEQAAELWETDAADLVARGAFREGAALLARARRVWMHRGNVEAQKRVGLAQAEALLEAGDAKAASDALEQLERLGPLHAEGLQARVAAAIAASQGNSAQGLQALQRASEVAVDLLDSLAWYKVESRLAEVLLEQRQLEQAETHAALALELARSICDNTGEGASFKDSARVSLAASFLAKIRVQLGRVDEARPVLQHALDQAAMVGDEASASRLLAHLAHVSASKNDLEGALRLGQGALDYACKVGDRQAAARIAVNVASYQVRLGMTSAAVQSFTRAKELARAVGWNKGVRIARQGLRKLRTSAP